MAIRLSTTLATYLAQMLGDYFGSGTVSIRTGAQPTSPNSGPSGTELAYINLSVFSPAVNGVTTMGSPAVMPAQATGTAGWARLADSMSTTSMDGTIGVSGSGADFIVNAVGIINGQNVTVSSISLTIPKA